MRWPCVVILLAIVSAILPAQEKSRTITFDQGDAGKLPSGWSAAQTGEGKASVWKVLADDTAPSKKGHALTQMADAPRATFNLCILEDARHRDVEISVAFKSVKGDIDQGGGVVWRYQDPNNYYVARMNPLERNFRLYKVEGGKRTQLATAKAEVPDGQWSVLQVAMTGNQITCKLDGKPLLEASDDTFQQAGKIGLWTKADAVTAFDDLKVRGK